MSCLVTFKLRCMDGIGYEGSAKHSISTICIVPPTPNTSQTVLVDQYLKCLEGSSSVAPVQHIWCTLVIMHCHMVLAPSG